MKIAKKHVLYFIIALILLELFLILGFLAADAVPIIQNTDAEVTKTLIAYRTHDATHVMTWITSLGDYEFVLHMTVIVGLFMAVFGHIEIALGIISSLALTHYFTNLTKNVFHVFRPEDYVIKAGGWSYPSGHTSAASILAIMIMWAAIAAIPHKVFRRIIILCATLYAVAVAISRIYLGVHWLSDVIGGALLAGAIGVLIMGLLKPVIIKRKRLANLK